MTTPPQRTPASKRFPTRPDSTPTPNFFIVGAPKCGTTSIHAYLDQHPDIFMSRYKEPYYFSDADVTYRVSSYPNYLALFREAGDAPVVGESSVGYLYSPATAARIRAYAPDARILIMARPPSDLARSLHVQLLKTGHEDIVSFRAAYDASPQRRRGHRIPSNCAIPMMLDYAARARYVDGIEAYLETFGPSQVRIVLLEDLLAHPSSTLSTLFGFLGVDERPSIDLTPRNVRPERLPNITARRMLKRHPALGRALRTIVPEPLWNGIKAASSFLQPQPEAASSVFDPGLASEVDRLERLLKRDLSHWKGVPPRHG